MHQSVKTHPLNPYKLEARSFKFLLWLVMQSGGIVAAITLFSVGFYLPHAAAREPDEFPPNPLEITTPDPLLPRPAVDRPLSPLERRNLTTALDELNAQATAQYRASKPEAAFEIWFRELRLRRALGPMEEVAALGRVGSIAWEDNYTTETRLITERLQAIQAEAQAQTPVNFDLLRSLGQAYLQVRDKNSAINVYQQLLARARQQNERATELATLDTIAQLYLNWFNYPEAAATYQELLGLVRTGGSNSAVPKLTEVEILKQLAYVYEQGKQPEPAIAVQQQLITLYQTQDPTLIPQLKLAIAKNYQALGQLNEAVRYYQETYTLAQPLRQFAYASDSLTRLGELYRSQNQLDAALRIYQFLIDVEAQSYNVYGRMKAYDYLGQIHLARKEYPQALAAFQQGLALAKQLRVQEDYFAKQITQLTQPPAQPAPQSR